MYAPEAGSGSPAPEFSVLLCARNEGERLHRTAADVLRHAGAGSLEIVVVDDASDDASASSLPARLPGGHPIACVRNESRRGLIASRARAASLARGRYLAFLDAHCAVSPGWLERLAAQLRAIDDRGLAVPLLHRLEKETWTIDVASGGWGACTITSPFLDFFWTEPVRIEGLACAPTISGGAWMCPREWYIRLGGLDEGMLFWGGENIDFPLRTWLAGGRCVVAEDVRVGHLYNDVRLGLMGAEDFVYNKIRAAHNVFGGEVFTRILEAFVYLDGFREALGRIHAERETLAILKDRFESARQRSDRWLIDAFRLPVLEDPLFHIIPRRPRDADTPLHRPDVTLVLDAKGISGEIAPLLASILDGTSYGNYEILVVSEGPEPPSAERDLQRMSPRVRMARISPPTSRVARANLAAGASAAEFLVLLSPDGRLRDPRWLEKLILLGERRPRLLLAFPRTRWISPESIEEEAFDVEWAWEAPGFESVRRGSPAFDVPYQALSSPDTLLFLRREPFLSLGGLDPTVGGDELPLLDLAIRGWIVGREVFCHPGVRFDRIGGSPGRAEEVSAAGALARRQYAQMLPAEKAFRSARRREACRERSPLAAAILHSRARHVESARRQLLERARFDDDWLFSKFRIEDPR